MNQYKRYLKILGIAVQGTGADLLKSICTSHLSRIPFENISKLHRLRTDEKRSIPSLQEYLDGIENNHFGGTCYSNNYFLNGLLDFLGFDVTLCAADMNTPHTHMVNLIRMDGKEFLVDVGYAAPFLSPLPRDLKKPFEIKSGNDHYILHPKGSDGSSRLELIRNGKLHHGYRFFPHPRKLQDFNKVIEKSFRPEAVFMNSVLLVLYENNGSTVIHNYTLIRTKGHEVRKLGLKSLDELINTIQDYFGIKPAISMAALEGINLTKDAWS